MKCEDILIFTDLDGSLLDHDNFEFQDIKHFILKCLDKGIKIIIFSWLVITITISLIT